MLHKVFVLIVTAVVTVTHHYLAWTSNLTPEPLPLLCYYTLKEPMSGSLPPDMNPHVCSHVIFLASSIDETCHIGFQKPGDGPKFAEMVSELRKQNPKLKLLMCNGGGNKHAFSTVLGSQKNRTRFAESILPFLKKYDMDGIDIDWEFPGWPGPVAARKNFTLQLEQIRDQLDTEYKTTRRKYTLSAAVAAGRSVMESYDIPALGRILDFINLMCYDYHQYGPLDPVTDYNSPLYPTDWDKKIVITAGNVGWSSYEWLKRGMPRQKIVVGLPTYAVTWTLEKPDQYHGHFAPATGSGRTCRECSYPWVCRMLQTGAVRVYDEDAAVPYTYQGDQWVSYDDQQSFQAKANWIVDNKFGGIMVFAMNDDDYNNTCHTGYFPLLTALRDVIQNRTTSL